MRYYIRYSEDICSDIERGFSRHYTGYDKRFSEEEMEGICNGELEFDEGIGQWVQKLPGLCAFELDAITECEAIEEAKQHHYSEVYNSNNNISYHILRGDYVDDCPEGDVIDNVELIYSVKKKNKNMKKRDLKNLFAEWCEEKETQHTEVGWWKVMSSIAYALGGEVYEKFCSANQGADAENRFDRYDAEIEAAAAIDEGFAALGFA
jgi:hypothetical protein